MQYLLFYQLEYWQILKIYPFSSIPLVKVYKKLVIHKKKEPIYRLLFLLSPHFLTAIAHMVLPQRGSSIIYRKSNLLE